MAGPSNPASLNVNLANHHRFLIAYSSRDRLAFMVNQRRHAAIDTWGLAFGLRGSHADPIDCRHRNPIKQRGSHGAMYIRLFSQTSSSAP